MERSNEKKAILDEAKARHIGIFVTPQFYEKIKEAARRDGISDSQPVRSAITDSIVRKR